MNWDTLIGDAALIITSLIVLVLFVNNVLAIVTMFRERREPSSLWASILVLFFVPVLGFLLWLFVDRRLTKETIFAKLEGSGIDYDDLVNQQTRALTSGTLVPSNEVARRNVHVVELLLERRRSPADRGQRGRGLLRRQGEVRPTDLRHLRRH